jgi:hypothetical protein
VKKKTIYCILKNLSISPRFLLNLFWFSLQTFLLEPDGFGERLACLSHGNFKYTIVTWHRTRGLRWNMVTRFPYLSSTAVGSMPIECVVCTCGGDHFSLLNFSYVVFLSMVLAIDSGYNSWDACHWNEMDIVPQFDTRDDNGLGLGWV